jgi:surface carbohydrate biosynthesis protein
MTDIVFFIEHRVREFDAAAAIRRHLKSRHGLEVKIAALCQHSEPALLSAAPKLVVLPWAQNVETSSILRSIVNAYPRACFLDMCWEQLLLAHVVETKAPKGYFAKHCILHHSWGPFRTAYLKSVGIPESHIFENGNPLYTLYQQRYRGLYPTKAQLADRHGLDPDKPWVLFPENYGWAFLTKRQIRRRYVSKGLPEGRALRTHRFQTESLREALRWFSRIHEPIEFILRPRPAITVSGYEAAFEKGGLKPGPSVRIIKNGPILEWIHASDLVMSSFSTTLLEAAVAGKPAFAIETVPFLDDVTDVAWMQQVQRVTSFEAFAALLKDTRRLPAADELAAFARGVAHPCEDALIGAADIMKRIVEMVGAAERTPHYIPEPLPGFVKRLDRQVREFLGLRRPKRNALEQAGVERVTEAEVVARTTRVDCVFSRAMS